MRCWIVVLLVVLTAMTNPTGGSAQDTALASSLHAGNCDQVGEVITDLSAATAAAGEPVGNVTAVPATSTFSVIPVALETLLTSDHVLIIPDPVSSQAVACGEIGGRMTGDGALIMGLRAEGQSGVTGVAYLVPDDDPTQTNISLFLTGEQVRTSASNPRDSLVDDVAVEQESITDAIDIAAPDDAVAYTSQIRPIIQTMTMSLAGFNSLMDDPQLNDDDGIIYVIRNGAHRRLTIGKISLEWLHLEQKPPCTAPGRAGRRVVIPHAGGRHGARAL